MDCRPRKSKAVGFGVVEETQFTQLLNENELLIQSESDMMKPGPPGIKSKRRSSKAVSATDNSQLRSNESTVTVIQSTDECILADSYTALKNALKDDKKL